MRRPASLVACVCPGCPEYLQRGHFCHLHLSLLPGRHAAAYQRAVRSGEALVTATARALQVLLLVLWEAAFPLPPEHKEGVLWRAEDCGCALCGEAAVMARKAVEGRRYIPAEEYSKAVGGRGGDGERLRALHPSRTALWKAGGDR